MKKIIGNNFIVSILIFTIFSQMVTTIGESSNGLIMTNSFTSIHIVGDEQFKSFDGIISGDGSVVDPYLIENLVIKTTNGKGIWIENVNKSFIIRNCIVININNFTSHSRDDISNDTIHDQTYGIYLEGSNNNTIHNNTIYNTQYGIYLKASRNNSIYENSIHDNEHGIYLYASKNNSIYNNSINIRNVLNNCA